MTAPSQPELARRRWPGRTAALAGALRRLLIVLAVGVALPGLWLGSELAVPAALAPYSARVQSFVTVFFGIFVEALPFLLAGVLASAAVHLFVRPEWLQRLLPRHPLLAALAGSVLGLAFPVCECGSVPAARSLIHRGAPLPLALAFMLAAPVVNPVVIASTAVAFAGIFGWEFVAWRIGLTVVVAATLGLLIGLAPRADAILAPAARAGSYDHDHGTHHTGGALAQLLGHAAAEFFEMSRFLVIGALLAASLQALVPPALLMGAGQDPLTAMLTMMALAVALSICSTVDSFVALAFVGTFPPAAILAFLVFGPIVDIKSSLMFTSVLQARIVAVLIGLTAQLVLLLTLLLHYYA